MKGNRHTAVNPFLLKRDKTTPPPQCLTVTVIICPLPLSLLIPFLKSL